LEEEVVLLAVASILVIGRMNEAQLGNKVVVIETISSNHTTIVLGWTAIETVVSGQALQLI
jgi:hypothetical protein